MEARKIKTFEELTHEKWILRNKLEAETGTEAEIDRYWELVDESIRRATVYTRIMHSNNTRAISRMQKNEYFVWFLK